MHNTIKDKREVEITYACAKAVSGGAAEMISRTNHPLEAALPRHVRK